MNPDLVREIIVTKFKTSGNSRTSDMDRSFASPSYVNAALS